MRRRAAVACAVVLLLLVPAGALGAEGRVSLSATLPDNRVSPGETVELGVQIMNTGSLEESGSAPGYDQTVTTARSVRAELRAGDAPVTVETGEVLLGAIPEGGVARAGFTVSVDEDAEPGTYRVPVRVRYEHTERINERSGFRDVDSRRETLYVTVRVEAVPRFRVVSAATDAPVGETGNVSLTLRNVGSEAARDARVSLRSESAEFLVGANGSASRFVGRWDPGENRTVDVPVAVPATAERANYTVATSVEYVDGDGDAARSDPLVTGVVPAPEQRFVLSNASASLTVGERGTVTATVRNAGPETARDAVVGLSIADGAVVPLRSEYAVGRLPPNESVTVEFPVRVTDGAAAGPYQFDLGVAYRNREDVRRTSDQMAVRATVAPDRDSFTLDPVNATFAPDDSERLVVELTNVGDGTRRDITVALSPSSPFTSVTPQVYVEELPPGESRRLAFELTVDEDAVEGTYALAANVSSESTDGNATASERYRVPIRVAEEQESAETGPLVAVVVLALLLLAGVGYWWYRR